MTKQQLVEKATAKGHKVIEAENIDGHELVAIRKTDRCMHWFFVERDGSTYFMYTKYHSTGKKVRGNSHMWRLLESLGIEG